MKIRSNGRSFVPTRWESSHRGYRLILEFVDVAGKKHGRWRVRVFDPITGQEQSRCGLSTMLDRAVAAGMDIAQRARKAKKGETATASQPRPNPTSINPSIAKDPEGF